MQSTALRNTAVNDRVPGFVHIVNGVVLWGVALPAIAGALRLGGLNPTRREDQILPSSTEENLT